ncbi:MAG: S-layer homology domain-containing protein, partial [Defluviitaleaceae bacterium]|nr:S-layer homology domain-containing protein [Defluviitaleaceae bacterium]
QNATAAEFVAGDTFPMPAEDKVLYAVWQINTHQVIVRHYTYGWNETVSDATIHGLEETFNVAYGQSFTATARDIAGHSFDEASSDAIAITMGDEGITIRLFYRQHAYELSIIPEITLAVNDRYPSLVDNSLTRVELVALLEVQTILNGEPLAASPMLTSPDFANVDFSTISTTPFVVTVNAVWTTGQQDSQTVLVHIVDKTPPVITVVENRVTFYTNNPPSNLDEVLALAGVSVLDNYDGAIQPTISFVGTTFEGIDWTLANMEYAMFVDAVDASGNVAERVIVTIVVIPPQVIGGGGNGGGSGGDNRPSGPTRPAGTPSQTPAQPQLHHSFLIGFEDGTIRPGATTTRAEVSTIFFRLMPDADRGIYWMQTNNFADVSSANWFNNAVSTTTNAGLFVGMPDGTFQPQREITRAELAAVIARYMGVANNGTPMFSDIAGHWAESYINAAAINGWVNGFPNGSFEPDRPITRAEAAAMINRMFNRRLEDHTGLLQGMIAWPDNANQNSWYYLYMQEATNSNYFEMKVDGVHKRWVELAPARDWTLLERANSRPEDINN